MSELEKPLISIIIPTYNRADLLGRAVKSVLEQTWTHLECIVVDDASTDHTADVVRNFDDERLIYLRHETNRHASAARNTGIARARGDLMAFLDDDDEWLPHKLERQVSILLDAEPEVGMVYCWMDYLDAQGQILKKIRSTHRGHIFPLLFDRMRIGGCQTWLLRTEAVQAINGFDVNLPRNNDDDFARRFALRYKIEVLPEVLVRVHIEHGHERISDYTEKGIRNALHGQLKKLETFAAVLDQYPVQTGNIHARIAFHYSQLQQWGKSLTHYQNALRLAPFSSTVWKSMLATLKQLVRPSIQHGA